MADAYRLLAEARDAQDACAAVAVDPEIRLIPAGAVQPGNAPDARSTLELVAQSEQHTGLPVTAAIADAAHGDGHTREQFADAGRTLIANLPTGGSSPRYNAT